MDTISESETVQLALKGMWTSAIKGCPHYVGSPDVGRCSNNEMRPCIYETYLKDKGCEVFKEIINEWKEYFDTYAEYLHAGVMPGNLE